MSLVSTPHGGLATLKPVLYLLKPQNVSTPHGGLATCKGKVVLLDDVDVSTPHGGLATVSHMGEKSSVKKTFQLHTVD